MAALLPFPSNPRSSGHREVGARASGTVRTTDAALHAAACTGDLIARGELFTRHSDAVSRIVHAIIGPEAEAEDIVHETFLRAYGRLHDVEQPERIGAWLRGMAVFVAREWLKGRARRRWSLFEDVPDTRSTEPAYSSREALRETFDVLSRMPLEERVVFSLRYIEGLEVEDLAMAMDASFTTTKRRLRDAEARFRKLAAKRPALRPYLEGAR